MAGSARARFHAGVQDLILELWARSRQGTAADPQRAETLRAARLTPEERAEVLRALRRMTRMRRRVDEALAPYLPSFATAARERARYFGTLLLSGEIDTTTAHRELPRVPWERVLAADAAIAAEADPLRRLARLHSYPDWLVAKLHAAYGVQTEALLQALDDDPPVTLRANRLRTTRDALLGELRRAGIDCRVGHAPDAVIVTTPVNAFQLAPFRAGGFELQDEGSQWIAHVVAPPPTGTVVDACAGSGGKSLALAALLGGKGHVLALDVAAHRLQELRLRARRAGASNLRALEVAELQWPDEALTVARRADRILVDAPCSGTGAIRRHPEVRWNLQPADLERLTGTQLRLARHAAGLLRPGARLVYATCSLLPDENDAVVDALRASMPSLQLVPLKEILGGDSARALGDGTFLRLRPDVHGCDGFFAAVLRQPA